MGMAVGGAGGGPRADINMTPMIDILLVLIIIFMVINPPDSKGLDALAPQPPPPNTPPDADARTVVVTVNKDRSLQINQQVVPTNELQQRLTDIFKTRAEKVAFVKGDPDVEFRDVAAAIDAMKGAGIEKVGLMTPKLEAGE